MTTNKSANMDALQASAVQNASDIVHNAIELGDRSALIIYDEDYGLTTILANAYRTALPNAEFINFNSISNDKIIAKFESLLPGDLVILIQSTNFLLNEFRIRLRLFEMKLKVIEHLHLMRNSPDIWDVYINSLAYDKSYYRVLGPALQSKLAKCNEIKIVSGDAILTITGGLEYPKLNIGDYTGMENIGGTFPIGEVFTEAKSFENINGELYIYAYAGSDFKVDKHVPFKIKIENGLVTSWDNAPLSFKAIMDMVHMYERPLIRELGFGLNRAITSDRYPQDITAFERILGLHVSLGEKHSVYKKPGITTHKTKFHIDLFPTVDAVYADGEVIFNGGDYTV